MVASRDSEDTSRPPRERPNYTLVRAPQVFLETDRELLAFVNSKPRITIESAHRAANLQPRQVEWTDPVARVLSLAWSPEGPNLAEHEWRRLTDYSGLKIGRVGITTKLFYPEDVAKTDWHFAKLCFHINQSAWTSLVDEARKYELLVGLQGVCIPTIKDYLEFTLPSNVCNAIPGTIMKDWARLVCSPSCPARSARTESVNPWYCGRLENSVDNDETALRCADCDALLSREKVCDIRVLALVTVEYGWDLIEVLAAARESRDHVGRKVFTVINKSMKIQHAILQTYLGKNPFEPDPLMPSDILVTNAPLDTRYWKIRVEDEYWKVLFRNLAKWNLDFHPRQTRTDTAWSLEHPVQELKIAKHNGSGNGTMTWAQYLASEDSGLPAA